MNAPEIKLPKLPRVSEQVGLSRTTIYRLIGRNEFPAPVKLGARGGLAKR